ncbi:hypothetical protein MBT84_32895 [Streptomyces sp. MBT84]|uniref:hypothetical protein n=1 Tax=Streptomyces sp. MBT84 TaxID=1488414 RepID=UPI001C6E8ECB|nr:hypothetical protein [Streptomyces sp. MBT84]MBW8704408.1 hypothetical protein [Streptomyces sp. MBT84]
MTAPKVFCASCARRLWRGRYLRCPLGCGAAVCRSNPACGNTHLPQCPTRTPDLNDPGIA